MRKLVWQNSLGNEINLTKAPFGIINWEGFSNAPLNIQSQQVPMQDGSVFLDALIENRDLSVTLSIQDGNDLEKRYELERQLIHILNLKLGEGYLIYTNDFISKRIKCVPQIPLFPNKNSNDPGTQKGELAWTACEPYWEDLEENIVSIDISSSVVINNEGDIPAQLKIEFESEGNNNLEIINITENSLIRYEDELKGKLYINTNVGQKSVILENFILKNYGIGLSLGKAISIENKGVFIIGLGGLILYSADGENFIQRNSHTSNDLYGLIYSKEKNLFVAVGTQRTIITSQDGINWVARDSGLSINVDFFGLVYSSYLDKFYIGGNLKGGGTGNYGAVSTDGINWTPVAQGCQGECCYSETLHIGISLVGTIIRTSSDLETWTNRSVAGNNRKTSVYWAEKESLFVLGDINGNIYTSSNSTSWTNRISSNLGPILQIGYSKILEKYFAITSQHKILFSDDCINWIISTISLNNDVLRIYDFEDISKLILIGQNGLIELSENLTKTTLIQKGINSNINSILYNQNLTIAVGNNGLIMYRSYENEWKQIDVGVEENFVGLCHASDKKLYVAFTEKKKGDTVGGNIHIFTSKDGLNWTEKFNEDVGAGESHDIAYSEKLSLFIIDFYPRYIIISSDGVSWRKIITLWGGYSIIYSEKEGLYFFGRNNGLICYSETRVEFGWNTITPAESTVDTIRSIAIDESRDIVVGVGDNGLIVSSNDKITSHIRESHTTENLNKVMFDKTKKKFYAVGNLGVIISSDDGEIWVKEWENQTSSINLNDVAEKNTEVYICGDNGLVEESFYTRKNMINKISIDSDMNMNLGLGGNRIDINAENDDVICNIKYRQKYIGV